MGIIQGGVVIRGGTVIEGASSPFGSERYVSAGVSVQSVVDSAQPGDVVYVQPGEYDEAVTVPRAKSNLTIVGLGGRGAAFVAPSTANADALTILADDVTVVNLGCDGDGTGSGVVNYGRRTRMHGCKVEGGANGLKATLGTVAQIAAGTHGKGDDCWYVDCEFAWNTNGVLIAASDYGAVTQLRFRECVFHDNSAADFEESGASADIRFRDLDVHGCAFRRQEDGTEPAKHLSLDDDNGNTGVVSGCYFPTALDGGRNLVSTGLVWAGNLHTGGVSNGQPS